MEPGHQIPILKLSFPNFGTLQNSLNFSEILFLHLQDKDGKNILLGASAVAH